MNKPLVSVCIPAFNRGIDIWRALESCIRQTYQNIEIVVGDNASTDNTKEIVLNYASRDKRIRYFRNEVNIGSGRNFLECAKRASGFFIQVLGDDDWLSENYIEECLKNFEISRKETAAVMTNVVGLQKKSENQFVFLEEDLMAAKTYSADWYFSNFYKHPNVGGKGFISFMRREDFLNVLSKEIARPTSSLKRGDFFEVIDGVLFPGVLSDYENFIVTNKASYIKTISGANVGLQGGYFKNPLNYLDYFHSLLVAYEAVFKDYKNLNKYVQKIRIFFGLNIVVKSVYFILSGKLSFKEFRAYFNKLRIGFFNDYHFKEKFVIGIIVIPRIFTRLIQRLANLILKKPVFSPNRSYFLSDAFEFIVD